MPQFATATFLPQIFWLACLFGGLYLLVKLWVFPTMQSLFQRRDDKLKTTLAEAESLKNDLQHIEEKIESHLLQAKKQAQHILKEAMIDIEEKQHQKEAQFMTEIDEKMHQLEQDIKKDTKGFEQKAELLVKALVQTIFKRLVEEEVSDSLLQNTLEKVKKQ